MHGEEPRSRRHSRQAAVRGDGARAMPVPCGCGISSAPTASKRCATTPSRSGWVTSISKSITAIGTPAPRTMRWTSAMLSFCRMYCAASPCSAASPREAGCGCARAPAPAHPIAGRRCRRIPAAPRRRAGRPPAPGSPSATDRPSVDAQLHRGRAEDGQVLRGFRPSGRPARRRRCAAARWGTRRAPALPPGRCGSASRSPAARR